MHCRILRAAQYLQGEDDISVQLSTVDDDCSMHSHEFVEIAYIVSGRGFHLTENHRGRVRAGDLFLLGERAPHGFTADEDAPLVVYNFHRLTNAVAEGINSVIQAGKRKARGFRTFRGFSTMTFLECAKIPFAPFSLFS